MRVAVTISGSLAGRAGWDRIELDLPQGSCLEHLLEEINSRRGISMTVSTNEYQWRHGEAVFVVSVDGRVVSWYEYNRTILVEGAEVWIFPPLSGG